MAQAAFVRTAQLRHGELQQAGFGLHMLPLVPDRPRVSRSGFERVNRTVARRMLRVPEEPARLFAFASVSGQVEHHLARRLNSAVVPHALQEVTLTLPQQF